MAANESIIDVLISIDADTILSKYGKGTDPANPRQITDKSLIYMITRQDDQVSGNAGAELNVKAETLDTIRWRETSLTLNAAYSAILYKFVATAGGNLISPPVPLIVEVDEPLPDPNDLLHPKSQTVKNYFWNCNVLQAGSVTYHFNFMIVDRHGDVQGYYWWDPFITITD
ncbi:MAG: inclusion body family protein [Bacteroidota bacterium]